MKVPIYRICGWENDFENYRTRVVKKLSWIPQKVSFNSDRITALIRQGGAEAYGTFRILCAVAAVSDERGTLISGLGTPHTPETLAAKTGVPEGTFACVLGLCLNLKLIEIKGHAEVEEGPECQDDDTTMVRQYHDSTTTVPSSYPDDGDRGQDRTLQKTTAESGALVPSSYHPSTIEDAAAAVVDKKEGEEDGKPLLSEVVAALTKCNMDPQVIPKLTANHPLAKIMQAIKMVRARGNSVRNVAGLVRSALDGNWESDADDGDAQFEQERKAKFEQNAATRAKQREEHKKQFSEHQKHLEILAALPPGDFDKLKQAAHEAIPPGMRKNVDLDGDPMDHGVWRSFMWTEYEKAHAAPQSGDLLPGTV